jgi:hypothetical protein
MHWPVMSQANTCTYCMGSLVSSLSRIYLYSSYFDAPDNSVTVLVTKMGTDIISNLDFYVIVMRYLLIKTV